MSLRDVAVEMARRGLTLFKIQPDAKEPLAGPRLKENASCDPDRVFKMWTGPDGEPVDNNIAVDTSDHIAVFDIDTKNGQDGFGQLLKAEIELGLLPDTFTVETPSGANHLYFRVPYPVSSSKSIGSDIDIQGAGKYVVAPGCTFQGRPYRVVADRPIAELPASWLARIGRASESPVHALKVVGDVDSPVGIEQARAWLLAHAEAVSEGNDPGAYRTACKVREFGPSEDTCYELMLELYNPARPVPAAPDRLRGKVAHAYAYAKAPQGHADALNQFDDVELPAPSLPAKLAAPAWRMRPIDLNRDPAATPRRQWVIKNTFLRQAISSIVAPGASGKSTLTIGMGIAAAIGRGDLMGVSIENKVRVGFINNEDPEVEFDRRVDAFLRHHNLTLHDFGTNPLITCEGPKFCIAARDNQQRLKMTPDANKLAAFIRDLQLDLVFVDPFVETHEGDENDNVEMSRVIRLYREIAEQTNSAICLVHHSKKPPQASSDGFAESMDAGRGASAVINAVRVGMNFFPMSPNDAKAANIDPANKYKYARLDSVKANLFLSDGQPAWYEKVSVPHPNGETYGVLVPCKLETAANLEANSYIDAFIAADGNDKLEAGMVVSEAAELIAHEAFIAHLSGDVKEIGARIKALFKDTRVWNGKQCYIAADDEKAKRKVNKLYLQNE